MTAWRQAIELSIEAEDLVRLVSTARSRTKPASGVERAQILLAYREDPAVRGIPHSRPAEKKLPNRAFLNTVPARLCLPCSKKRE